MCVYCVGFCAIVRSFTEVQVHLMRGLRVSARGHPRDVMGAGVLLGRPTQKQRIIFFKI